jgi:hypothetical protein
VSCASKSHCLAVGSYRAHSDEFAVAESWNGSKWTTHAVPAGISAVAGISCLRANSCLAVAPGPAALLWNGSKWRKLTVPKQAGLGLDPSLNGISCASANNCIAVGGSDTGPFADAWTGGTSLKSLSISNISGQYSSLSGISCPSSSSCLAVGSPLGEFTGGGNLAMTWNGRGWRAIRQNRSDALAGVSCVTSSDCLAVGSYRNTSDYIAPLAEYWDGTTWHKASPPDEINEPACLSA